MIHRDYKCTDCGHEFEAAQRIIEDILKVCPQCNGVLETVFLEAPYAIVENDPVTIGQLADRNRKKMGRYELQTKEKEDHIDELREIKEVKDKRKKINKMTKKQQEKYIREGK